MQDAIFQGWLMDTAIGALAALCVILLIQIKWQSKLVSLFRSDSGRSIDADELPCAVVILSLRGADPFLADCLHAVFQQDYPRYKVRIVIDSHSDPAWDIVQQTVVESGATNVEVSVLNNRRETCSLKNSALLQAIGTVDDRHDVVALLDADPQHHSPSFRRYAEQLVERLSKTYDLCGKTVLEIGCGDGYFLGLLCRRGGNRGWGFDPSHRENGHGPSHAQVTWIRDEYRPSLVDSPADFICCRHVLEHVAQPSEFIRDVQKCPRNDDGAAVYFEVPNAQFTLNQGGIWDILYEHCSYFTAASLHVLFRREGFDIRRIEPAFAGQFLQLEARIADRSDNRKSSADSSYGSSYSDVERLAGSVEQFAGTYRSKLSEWSRTFERFTAQKQSVVLWGAGTKGISLLNMLGIRDSIRYVVDLNPEKAGCYIPCTGQQVITPAALHNICPDVVIVLNPNYETEIRSTLRDLGLPSEILVA